MYGLKEKTIGKLLVKVTGINMNSVDASNVLNWRVPVGTAASANAGDFAARCYELVSKRSILTEVGSMTIEEVNDMLDQLSAAQKEVDQMPIFQKFYSNMNADELMWLIRIILRQMKVGATERTFFDIWHPDAESLFNISSNLRRVCWGLYDPDFRLEPDDRGITVMQCFQPQLAQFQMHSFQKMVAKLRPTEDDAVFWIEEKLDGERIQLHMAADNDTEGGGIFAFWSRKAKDYTYLYGHGFKDENSALTRHIQSAFADGVRDIVLDGEMIAWDMDRDAIVPFGTLKTVALSEQRNPNSTAGQRPVFRVFDILYLNGKPLTGYTLRDRRAALEKAVRTVHRRLEIHEYQEATDYTAIDPLLRKVVAEASEGLVLKNPRSAYRLNERNDDWMKVKPEYMTEFGELLDCLIIAGYYGSGYRGGNLSSFLCGLRLDDYQNDPERTPMKFWSFFKVGGGLTASDYAEIRHRTDGKWVEWNNDRPPQEYVELAGGGLQYERPDVWIKPSDSVVVSVKAASVSVSDQFRTNLTLRFPRFQKLRLERTWKNALSFQEFVNLKSSAEKEKKEKAFQVDDSRKKRLKANRVKKPLTVAGGEDDLITSYGGPRTGVFEGLSFCRCCCHFMEARC
jgi:DNA ligase-4